MEYSTFGRHIAVDAWGIEHNLINDTEFLKCSMVRAADASGATILDIRYHLFDPHGVSILLLLSESHFTIHTYPEKGFVPIDCYTCGETVDPQIAVNQLLQQLKPEKVFYKKLVLGIGEIEVAEGEKY